MVQPSVSLAKRTVFAYTISRSVYGFTSLTGRRIDMSAAQTSWRQQGLPAFDIGPDGFPRPGQIIRHFRQTKLKADGKPWTQRDLAQVLGKQELAMRDM